LDVTKSAVGVAACVGKCKGREERRERVFFLLDLLGWHNVIFHRTSNTQITTLDSYIAVL
jgi:hypothetical protein